MEVEAEPWMARCSALVEMSRDSSIWRRALKVEGVEVWGGRVEVETVLVWGGREEVAAVSDSEIRARTGESEGWRLQESRRSEFIIWENTFRFICSRDEDEAHDSYWATAWMHASNHSRFRLQPNLSRK